MKGTVPHSASYSSLPTCFHRPLEGAALSTSSCILPALCFTRSEHMTNLCSLHARNNRSSRATEFHPMRSAVCICSIKHYTVSWPLSFFFANLQTRTYFCKPSIKVLIKRGKQALWGGETCGCYPAAEQPAEEIRAVVWHFKAFSWRGNALLLLWRSHYWKYISKTIRCGVNFSCSSSSDLNIK